MSLPQETSAPQIPLPPMLLRILSSNSSQDRLIGFLILMQRCHPIRFQVSEAGLVVPVPKLMEYLSSAIRTARNSSAHPVRVQVDDQHYQYGLKLVSEIPKRLSVGQKFSLKFHVIDRQGEVCSEIISAKCSLSILGISGRPESMEIGRKRGREEDELLCGDSEVDVQAESGAAFRNLYFADSSKRAPRGTFVIRVACLGLDTVKPLDLPGIRVC